MKTKFLAAFLCLSLCLSAFVGCNGGGTSTSQPNDPSGSSLPDYDAKSDLELVLSSWYSPAMTEESIETYMAAGFNEIILQGHNVGGFASPERYEAALLCESKGLNFYLSTENSLEYLLVNSDKYNALEHLIGIDVYDEPLVNDGYNSLGNFSTGLFTLANYIEAFEEAYDDVNFFTNLHPLEASGSSFPQTYTEYVDVTCTEILAKLTEGERWLSADSYVLRRSGSTDKSYYLKANWLQTLAYLADAKYVKYKDLGIKTNFYIQAMPFSSSIYDRTPTYEDLSLQIYALLAFGFDGINYFCYATPPENFEFMAHQHALVDRDGNTTPTYDAAKRINHEILAFDHVYKQFNANWKGVIPIIGTKNTEGYNESFDNLSYIKDAVTSIKVAKGVKNITADHDTIVGVMQDDAGNPGFMVVNYNDSARKYEDNVTFEFSNAQKALVYRNGVKTVVDVVDNTLTLKLGIGEGVFVIPYAV